ncbi:MAG: hypothetical protein ACR2QF_14320, partial [Geminicoccaceae bacterium]
MIKSFVAICLVFGLALAVLARDKNTGVDQDGLNSVMIDFAISSGVREAMNSEPGCATVTNGAM